MHLSMIFRFMLIAFLIAGVSISSGCSQEDGQKKKAEAERVMQERKREEIRERLREQVRKEQEKRNPRSIGGIEADKQMEKKHRADAESCMKEFQSCTDGCKNKRCEDECLRILSICEKEVPKEFQTLKGD
jgi:hypothetical protein